MACGTVATAEAADIRAKGVWDFLGEWSNVAPRNDRNDRFGAMQRLRTQVDVIAALAKFVHPIRGAKPGTVRIDRMEPAIIVTPDPSLEEKLAL